MILMRSIRWMFRYKSLKEKFIKLGVALFILLIIGLARLVLEVILGINLGGKWFSFDKDIIFVMSVFPFYLCFFLFMCAHILLKLFKIKVDAKLFLTLFFFIQFIHLLIPLCDYLAFYYKLIWRIHPFLNSTRMFDGFSINPFSDLKNIYLLPIYFTPLLLVFTNVTTLGINIAWFFSGFIFVRFLMNDLKSGVFKTLLIVLILFQIVYWPIYKYFFVFDRIFNKLASISYYNHYGYGFYFLIFGVVGFAYFLNQTKKSS